MTTRSVVLAVAISVALAAGCVSLRIGDPNTYEPVLLNRVFPYPSDEELSGQRTEVILAAQYIEELPRERVRTAMTLLLASLDRYLSAAGAGVIDRSIHDLASVRDELEAAEGRGVTAGFTGADWAIVARVDKFRHWSEYDAPTSLFKNEEELRDEPGDCRHHADVEVRLRAFEIPTDDVARLTITLANSGSFEETDFDESCPIEKTRKLLLLEDVLKEVLPCLEAPIKDGYAPLGYIEEHRANAKRHIYRTSMGSRNGAVPGLALKIFRVQYMTTRDYEKIRSEHQVGEAVMSEKIGENHSWIIVDPRNLKQPILEGDLLRAVYRDPWWSTLGAGICNRVLTVQGTL
jgi:hypothetical protein